MNSAGVLLARIQTVEECRSYLGQVSAQAMNSRRRLLETLNSAALHFAFSWGGTLYVWQAGDNIVTQLLFATAEDLAHYKEHLEHERESERLRKLSEREHGH